MIVSMVKEIMAFLFLIITLMMGFVYALAFIIGPDKEQWWLEVENPAPPGMDLGNSTWNATVSEEQCDVDDSASLQSGAASISLYLFQVMLGQQEWSETASNDCLSEARSWIMRSFLSVFSVLATVLLLNFLIAMMASTYEKRDQQTSKDINFSRTEETYELAHRNALIAAPLNVVAYAFFFFFEMVSILVVMCSAGKLVF